uniref:Parvin alpha n=1 Tax=Ficedula albicollis TaxID=59894 RepID=A0A803WGB0_FICAL
MVSNVFLLKLPEENEVRTMVDPNSRNDPKLQELMKVLIDWINDVLVGERIIVKDLAEDLYDGQVLQKLFEKLESEKLNVAEVTQSEIAQKQKLQTVLEKINETLKLTPRNIKWNVDSVHAKSLVAILHLLVALSQYFRAPIRLPDHVSIQVVVVQKREGILQSRQIQEEITGNTEALSGRHERDAFDTLFDHAPDKLNVVKKVGRFLFLEYLMCSCACLCVSDGVDVVSVCGYNVQLARFAYIKYNSALCLNTQSHDYNVTFYLVFSSMNLILEHGTA